MLTVSRSAVDLSGLGGIWDGPSHSGNVYIVIRRISISDLLWARRHLGWTITQWKRVYCDQTNQYFRSFFGINGRRVLRTKEEKDHPDFYQQQVQKPGSVMVWGCVKCNL